MVLGEVLVVLHSAGGVACPTHISVFVQPKPRGDFGPLVLSVLPTFTLEVWRKPRGGSFAIEDAIVTVTIFERR